MLELDGPGGMLTTFRTDSPIHSLGMPGECRAERIADHRRIYLEYEGPLSGGRGEVSRVARGAFEGGFLPGGNGLTVRADFGGGPREIRGWAEPGGGWRLAIGEPGGGVGC